LRPVGGIDYCLNMFNELVQSRAEQKDATRRKVLDTAEHLFREHGFASTTVRQIAAEAGVSSGSVMAVGDKATLLVEVVDRWIGAVHRDRRGGSSSSRRLGSKAAADEVVALLEPFLNYFMLDLALAREYAAVLVRGEHASIVFTDLARALVDELAAVLARTGRGAAAAERGARALYYLYLGVLMAAAGGAIDAGAAEEQLRSAVRFALITQGDHP